MSGRSISSSRSSSQQDKKKGRSVSSSQESKKQSPKTQESSQHTQRTRSSRSHTQMHQTSARKSQRVTRSVVSSHDAQHHIDRQMSSPAQASSHHARITSGTPSSSRAPHSAHSNTAEHRIVLPAASSTNLSKERTSVRNSSHSLLSRAQSLIASRKATKKSNTAVKRPRIVEDRSTASKPGAFVDANKLKSEDIVAKTLQETSSFIGVATRPKVVDFTARQKEQHRANMRRIAINISAAIAAIAVVIALIWFLFFSPVFLLQTDKIVTTGTNAWVSDQQIIDIASKQSGKSLFLVSTGQMEEELSQIPGVSSAEASKQFPNGLQVTVNAQRPAAMLKTSSSDTLTAVDSQARVLNAVKETSTTGIPIIEVESVNKALKERAIQTALVILDALPESWRTEITSVQANTQDSVTTKFNNGITVIWGDSSELKLKKAIVDKIMNDPKVIGDKTQINVSAPNRPIIK